MAAYYNGGSRPNQTPESWAYARVYSYIMGGNTRKVDVGITRRYNVEFIHFIKAAKTLKKDKIPKKRSVSRKKKEALYIVKI